MVLHALGSNGSGQLGIGNHDDVSIPTLHLHSTEQKEKPIKIVAGGNHTLILYSSGKVYIIGSMGNSVTSELSPQAANEQRVLLAENVELCAAAWQSSTVWTSDALYSFGAGAKGELGKGVDITNADISEDTPIFFSYPTGQTQDVFPVDLASGMQHTVAVMSDGSAWGWGNGRKGQLGEPSGIVWQPRKIDGLNFKVVRAVCGREFTYLVGDSQQGQHAVIGNAKWGVKANAPQCVAGWIEIGASWASILVLLASGEIISWGRDDHGQLAPKGLPRIRTMANGSEHSLAVTTENTILAWGWGEHGNCGPEVDENGDVKHRWNMLPIPDMPDGKTLGVGAGCATSWIWS